jgi:hypothetical protein
LRRRSIVLTLALTLVFASALPATAAGTMMLRFGVKGPLDFTKVRYVMVFNTTGNGMEPYANPITGILNYSFAWVVGGSGGIAQPQLFQYFAAPGAGPGPQGRPIVVPPQLAQLSISNTGAPGEFTLTFSRALFNVPSPTGQKLSPIWAVNFITTDLAGNPIDANGTTGITDTSFLTYARINTAQPADLHYFKPAGSTAVSNPSAAIAQNEVSNSP